jgi:predicted Zn-ribbon and HTH transcriptional regulator
MKICKDKKLGYLYVIMSNHPMANKNGRIYVHRLVMADKLGRLLESDEVVHHKDGNKENNDPENLDLTSRVEHAKHHANMLDNIHCKQCGVEFKPEKSKNKYCSVKCSRLGSRKFDISKELLSVLVWIYPSTKIARMYKVSDKAIEKRCKLYEIDKPKRGYWAKVKSTRSIPLDF